MTRVLANYSDDRIRAVVITQLECNPGAHHQLIADYAAEVLTGVAPEDDDGNAAAAAAPKNEPRRQPAAPKSPEAPAEPPEVALLAKLLKNAEHHDKPKYQADLEALRKMDAAAAAEVDARIKAIANKEAA